MTQIVEQTVRTLLVDPGRLFREGLKELLANTRYHLVAETQTHATARDILMAADGSIELVIADFGSEEKPEHECITELREAAPAARLVVLTANITSTRLVRGLDAGADGFLLKEISPEALEKSLHLVMLGEKVFPTHLATLLINGRFGSGGHQWIAGLAATAQLSAREAQILQCLVNGEPNKVIARNLSITEATVKVHLKTLLKKINATNRTQAAIWALSHRMVRETDAASGDSRATA